MEKKFYNFVSKATRINPLTDAEVPCETFTEPCELVAVDKEYYYVHILGHYELDVPVVSKIERDRYDIKECKLVS